MHTSFTDVHQLHSPIQRKIYKVSDCRFHMLRSPPILAGRENENGNLVNLFLE